MEFTSDALNVDEEFDAANETLYQRGMTDGLPVILPTADRVESMLKVVDWEPTASLGTIPPRYGEATIEKVAINAVMAGCDPTYMPVLTAAVRAMTTDEFNLYGINATTHPAAPLLVVNGPIIDDLNLNYGYNVFGPGWKANSTIGRAIRLLLVNVGGGKPGDLDRATHGHPGKYSFCIAENEAASPWNSFHTTQGFDADESTVTVMGVEAPHEINDHVSGDAAGVLTVTADTLSTVGHNNTHHTHGQVCIVFGPEHADTIARDGWSRKDVQWFLYDQARNDLEKLRTVGIPQNYGWHHRFGTDDKDARIPLVEHPEDILILVAGGAGKHSMGLPSFGETRAVTEPVEREP